jgi:hypothetical protein
MELKDQQKKKMKLSDQDDKFVAAHAIGFLITNQTKSICFEQAR